MIDVLTILKDVVLIVMTALVVRYWWVRSSGRRWRAWRAHRHALREFRRWQKNPDYAHVRWVRCLSDGEPRCECVRCVSRS